MPLGTNSCSGSSRFGASSAFAWVTLVTYRPAGSGWRQGLAGSGQRPLMKTIGMVSSRLCRGRAEVVVADNGQLSSNQVGDMLATGLLAIRPAVFDCDIPAIDVTGFAQPFQKGGTITRA